MSNNRTAEGGVRLVVVGNAKAGSGAWPGDAIHARLEAAGHESVVVSSSDLKAALDEPADAFVAAGGDGTVHRLARALAGSERPLAIIPLGTANNIARAFGFVPGADPFGRVDRWGEDERTLRLAVAHGGDSPLTFLEVVGAGPFARLLRKEGTKKRRLPLARLMSARRRLLYQVLEGPVLDAEISLDGCPIDGRFVMIAGLRIPSFGPALWLAPEQRPDDDHVTVVGVRNDQRERFAWWLATGEGDVGAFRLGTGTVLKITSDGPIHVDDTVLDQPKSERRTVSVAANGQSVRMLT